MVLLLHFMVLLLHLLVLLLHLMVLLLHLMVLISFSNKTQCILFATLNFNKRTETFQIIIDDTVRHMEDKVKNLGVIFDSRHSFEHHIISLSSRLNGTLSYLNRVKNTLD